MTVADDAKPSSFAKSMLPLYNGPRVKICIGSPENEYIVSMDLLCEQSPYFQKMFHGNFIESKENSVTLEEIDGVVSPRSFDAFLEWMYRCRMSIDSAEDTTDKITRILEFCRIADMFDAHGMEEDMTLSLKGILVGLNSEQRSDIFLPQQIQSAGFLPSGHPVRTIIAKALVLHFMGNGKTGHYEYLSSLGFDLLKELKILLKDQIRASSEHWRANDFMLNLSLPDPIDYHHVSITRCHINGT